MKRIAFIVISILIALLLSETLLHFFPDPLRQKLQVTELRTRHDGFDFDHHKIKVCEPPLHWHHDTTLQEYNQAAIFGSPALNPSAEEFRILLLGDSVTEWGCFHPEGFDRLLEQRLNEAVATGSVRILNAGHGGYNIRQSRELFEKFCVKSDFNAVVLATVNNDLAAAEIRWKTADRMEISYFSRIEVPLLVDFGSWNQFIYQRLRLPALLMHGLDRVGLATAIPRLTGEENDNLQALSELVALCRERQYPFYLVHFPQHTENWSGYTSNPAWRVHQLISKKARSLEIPFLDLLTDFQQAGGLLFLAEEVKRLPVSVHPNARGHGVAGEAIARFLLGQGVIPESWKKVSAGTPATESATAGGYQRQLTRETDIPALASPVSWRPESGPGQKKFPFKVHPGEMLFYYPDGSPLSAVAADDVNWTVGSQSIVLQAGSRLDLYPDGSLLSGTLAQDHEFHDGSQAILLRNGTGLILSADQTYFAEIPADTRPVTLGNVTLPIEGEACIFADRSKRIISARGVFDEELRIGRMHIHFSRNHWIFVRYDDAGQPVAFTSLADNEYSCNEKNGHLQAGEWKSLTDME